MSKKTLGGAASTASSTTQKSQKSSISKAAFAPSHLQLYLFASVIQGFESQHLRIHDVSTGRLRCEHAAAARARITSLAWGYYGTSYRESQQDSLQKKRKRNQDMGEQAVVAYGLSNSEICMFSPAEGRIIGRLSGVHERGIKDFQFVLGDRSQGWSLGEDAKLVQWNLTSNMATRTISLPESSISTLASPTKATPQILCASPTPYTISFDEDEQPKFDKFDSFKNVIHTIFRSNTDGAQPSEQFLAADNDRYINVYDIAQRRLTRTLIAGSEVDSADFYTPSSGAKTPLSEQLLAVVTREGLVELFAKPFTSTTSVNGDLKSKRKNQTSKATAKVKLVSSNSTKAVPIFRASFQGPDLVVAIAEGGVDVTFQKVRWQDEGNGELLFDGVREFKYNKTASTLNTVTMNGAKDTGRSHVDESKTVVINGDANGSSQNAAIEIESSDEDKEPSEGDSKDEESSDEGADATENQEVSDESIANSDEAMEDAVNVPVGLVEMGDDAPKELSFGELLARKHPETITVTDGLHPESSTLVQVEDNKAVSIPTGISLSTVLTQSLRTNDQNLLESCLHNTDADIIKNTIQRIDSSLAGILLQKLAERLASRPGRYGHLLIWVQWTCIVHGGAVAGRPEVFSKISTLYGVLTQRAKSLDSLLLLKGKLDMLDAQLTFRRDIQSHRGVRRGHEEANVVYVDEDDNWSSDEDEAMDALPAPSASKKPKKALKQLVEESDSEEVSGDDEEMPVITNGLNSDSDEEEGPEDAASESEDDVPIQKSKAKPANKLDAIIDDEADESHPSDEESASSDEEEDSDEEADSEMDDFINDDSIDEEVVEDDVMIGGDESLDETEEIANKPKKKKLRTA